MAIRLASPLSSIFENGVCTSGVFSRICRNRLSSTSRNPVSTSTRGLNGCFTQPSDFSSGRPRIAKMIFSTPNSSRYEANSSATSQ